MSINEIELKKVIEAALFAADHPLTVDQLMALFIEEGSRPTREEISQSIAALQQDYADRGVSLKEVSSGFRFQARQEFAPWISRLWEERPPRYSRALLETLSLIVYRQPITRGEIEAVRGVSVSSTIIKTLQERNWVKVVGHKDLPGKPALYATTRDFLDYFNLKSLDELPSLSDLMEFEALSEAADESGGDTSIASGGETDSSVDAAAQDQGDELAGAEPGQTIDAQAELPEPVEAGAADVTNSQLEGRSEAQELEDELADAEPEQTIDAQAEIPEPLEAGAADFEASRPENQFAIQDSEFDDSAAPVDITAESDAETGDSGDMPAGNEAGEDADYTGGITNFLDENMMVAAATLELDQDGAANDMDTDGENADSEDSESSKLRTVSVMQAESRHDRRD